MVIVAAKDVWGVFQNEKDKLDIRMHEIANNPDTGVVIFLTTVTENGVSFPDILVNVDDEAFYEESCFDEQDCFNTVSAIYDDYLLDNVKLHFDDDDADTIGEEIMEDLEIEARENDIDSYLYDFLYEVLDGDIDTISKEREGEFFKDVKEHFLEYLFLKWDINIRRPMYLEDEDGEVTYEEYPYGFLEFEDVDDPIYFNS